MKEFYMDTNVFVSRLKSDDPYFLEARAIFKGLEKDELLAETSVLTLVEVAAAASKIHGSKRRATGDVRNDRARKVYVIKALKRLAKTKTKFVNIAGETPSSIKGIEATLPNVFHEALLMSLQSDLRTLDLMHLAVARHCKRMNQRLGAFVTGDNDFLLKKRELAEVIGMPLLSPAEYSEALGLTK